MPSLKAIKKRLSAVIATHKLTKAMQIISASKFYSVKKLFSTSTLYLAEIHILISRAMGKKNSHLYKTTTLEDVYYPTNLENEVEQLHKANEDLCELDMVIVFSASRGLCGRFSNLISKNIKNICNQIVDGGNRKIRIICTNKRTFDAIDSILSKETGLKYEILLHDLGESMNFEDFCLHFGNLIPKMTRGIRRLFAFYPSFISTTQQEPCVVKLFPVVDNENDKFLFGEYSFLEKIPTEKAYKERSNFVFDNTASETFLFEPKEIHTIPTLFKKYIEAFVYNVLLETALGENAARMLAMDNANRNSNEMQKSLKIQYNKQRQSIITQEIIEISSSALDD